MRPRRAPAAPSRSSLPPVPPDHAPRAPTLPDRPCCPVITPPRRPPSPKPGASFNRPAGRHNSAAADDARKLIRRPYGMDIPSIGITVHNAGRCRTLLLRFCVTVPDNRGQARGNGAQRNRSGHGCFRTGLVRDDRRDRRRSWCSTTSSMSAAHTLRRCAKQQCGRRSTSELRSRSASACGPSAGCP